MTPASAAEWVERSHPPAVSLAEAVSPAIRIESQLLRKMRLALFPDANAGDEADVWLSPAVESRAASGIVFHPSAAAILRQRLAQKPATLESAWAVTESLHRNISPALFAEERLAYLALAGKYAEMQELLRSIVATMLSPRGKRLAGWAARAIGRLPDRARFSEEGQMLAFGASLRLGEIGLTGVTPPLDQLAEWSAWLSPDDLETVPFGVAFLEDAVEFGPVGRTLSHRIEFPKTTPVLVELSWEDGERQRRERVVLPPEKLTIVEIGPGLIEVEIRTVLGDVHVLSIPERRRRESLQRKLNRVRAPRVHITYDVETGGAIELRDLPFVVGVLADLTAAPEQPLPPLLARQFVPIDRDNFDQVMALMNPRIAFRMLNALYDDDTFPVELRFHSLADFEPAQVARQIEPLRRLLERRTLIDEIRSHLTGNDELENALERVLFVEPLSEQAKTRLFAETVEEVVKSTGLGKDRVEKLVTAFGENVRPRSENSQVEAAVVHRIAEIDEQLSFHVRQALHHPDFQALETTWRGLYYLVSQTETSNSLKIKVWNVNQKELADDLARSPDFDQSVTFKKFYEETYGVYGGEPFGVLLGAYEFARNEEDMELLENMSRIAAAAHAPFLAAASPQMIGVDNFVSSTDLNELSAPSSDSRWNNFRESEESKYVGLSLPHILLRLPYGNTSMVVDEFSFEEVTDGSDRSQFLWGNAAFALASRITNAFATYGWCAAIRGVEGGGLVEGLPVYTFQTSDGSVALKSPTEITIVDRSEKELSDAGFIPLAWMKGTDYACFLSVSSVHKPQKYESPRDTDNAQLARQLPYIFAASRFAHYLACMMRDKVGSFMSRGQAEQFLNRWIVNYVVPDDAARPEIKAKFPLRDARINIEELEGKPGAYRAIAFLRPHFQLEELNVALRVVVRLPFTARA